MLILNDLLSEIFCIIFTVLGEIWQNQCLFFVFRVDFVAKIPYADQLVACQSLDDNLYFLLLLPL